MSVSINGTNGLVFNDNSAQNTAATGFGFKNRIINGAMMIDQRNAGASVTVNNATITYPVDRFFAFQNTGSSSFSVQRSTLAPAGFNNSLLWTSTTGVTASAAQQARLTQRIEGFNVSDLGWGTASAQTVTVSFWVRSSITGTFAVALLNSAGNRAYVATFTINSANTFEYKTVTIAGDTSGTWLSDNSTGIQVVFDLGSGSNFSTTAGSWAAGEFFRVSGSANVIGTTGATFYITGVQLEKGSTATSFDYRPYGTELALCQRYCFNLRSSESSSTYYTYGFGNNLSTTRCDVGIPIPVTMRATPSLTTTGTASNYAVYEAVGVVTCSAVPALGGGSGIGTLQVTATTSGTLTAGRGASLISANNNISYLLLTAEL